MFYENNWVTSNGHPVNASRVHNEVIHFSGSYVPMSKMWLFCIFCGLFTINSAMISLSITYLQILIFSYLTGISAGTSNCLLPC